MYFCRVKKILLFICLLIVKESVSSPQAEYFYDVPSQHIASLRIDSDSQISWACQPRVNPFGKPPLNCAEKVLEAGLSDHDFLGKGSPAKGLNGKKNIKGISLVKTDELRSLSFLDSDLDETGCFFVAVPLEQVLKISINTNLSLYLTPDPEFADQNYVGLFFSYEKSSILRLQFEYVKTIKLTGLFHVHP